MGSLGNIFLKFGADTSDIKKGIKDINTSLGDFKKNAEGIGKSLNFIEATAGINLLKDAFEGVSGFASDLIKEFDADAKAGAKLTQALHGNAAGAKELLAQASKLQETRLFPDEVTANADALLASLGLETQSIKTLIPLIQDFASTFGLDLDTATKTVGKSIVTGSNALKKFGIDIGETNGAAERYTATVKALSSSMEGQAAIAGRVGAGPLQLLSQRFSEIKEISGEALVKFVSVFIPLAETGVDSLKDKLSGLPNAFENIGKAALPLIRFFGSIEGAQEKLARGLGLGALSEKLTGIAEPGSEAPRATNRSDLSKTIADLKAQKEAAAKLKAELARFKPPTDPGAGGKDDSKYISPAIQKILNDEEVVNKVFARLGPKIVTFKDKLASIFDDHGRSANNVARGPIINLQPLQNASTYVRPLNDQLTALNATSEQLGFTWKDAFNNIVTGVKGAKQSFDNLAGAYNQIIESGIEESLAQVGVQLGNLAAWGKFDFSAILSPLADVLINVGKLAIATGIAVTAIGEALANLHGIGAIVAGIALVALGSFVKASLGKSSKKFGKGVLSFGEHLGIIGDNPNARFDPEVTAPSSKLKSIFENVTLPKLASFIPRAPLIPNFAGPAESGFIDGIVGRVSGSDLVLLYDRNRATQLRQRGY